MHMCQHGVQPFLLIGKLVIGKLVIGKLVIGKLVIGNLAGVLYHMPN